MDLLNQTSLKREEKLQLLTDGLPLSWRDVFAAAQPADPTKWIQVALSVEHNRQESKLRNLFKPKVCTLSQQERSASNCPFFCPICMKKRIKVKHWLNECPDYDPNYKTERSSKNTQPKQFIATVTESTTSNETNKVACLSTNNPPYKLIDFKICVNKHPLQAFMDTVDSPIASPLVCVPKKNGKIRICADFKRTLNPFIEDVKYPIPNIDNVLHSFFGKSIFSKIDLSSAYHQILLDEESQKLTVISTHKGLFKYKRLPFGIKSGATIFQRTMDNIFSGLKNVIIYLDDILIASSDVNEHISDIETVMNKLSDFNFSINKEKSLFFVDEINYLGHRINKNGIYPLEDKLDSIKKCPKPSNISELKSFLGMLSFYSKFVRNLSIQANPLFSLLKRSYNWNWKNEHDQAFEKCKNLISTKTCLTHYSQDLPLYVTCDASNYGIGGYISHIVNGIEKPITFVSRTLNDTEKKYSQIEKEGLSIFFTLNRLKQFLYGRKFIINTDHKPLLAIFGDKNNLPALVANRLHRWSLSISNFNFEIKYTKGTEIPLADFLSRFPNPEKGEKEEEMGEILLIENSILDYVLVSYKTQEDPTLRKLYKLVKYDKYDIESEVDIKPYNRIKNEITI
ncbi:K02A2.6-like, partial [Cordylochernes scorpioides]